MRIIYVILVLVSFNSWGQSSQNLYRLFPVLECPKVGEEYEKMLAKLESVKSSIRTKANCTNVELQVESLQKLVINDRQEIMDIVGKTQNEPLSEEQAKKVRLYAENITKKVAALSDLFMRTNQCFEEDNAGKQISTLAGFVSEASSLVGSLSGPWGAPIALAGNVIAGFMTGLEQVLKSRAGYDFSKPDQWSGYVQNLCTYHSFRDQIDHLLNPQAKINQLKDLKFKLELQIQMYTATCTECQTIERAFNATPSGPPPENEMFTLNSEARNADLHFNRPVGTYTLQNLGLRQWTIREIARIERESQTYWSDVSGRNLLYRAKENIEQFLLIKEAPRFLEYQIDQGRDDFANFKHFQFGPGRALYKQIQNTNPALLQTKVDFNSWSLDPLDLFRALVIKAVKVEAFPRTAVGEELKFSLDYFRAQSLVRLRTAQTSAAVAQSFCSFFKHSGRYSPAIRGQCTNPALTEVLNATNGIDNEVRAAQVVLERNPHPIVTSPEDNTIYSMTKVEALIRAIEFRGQGN